MFKLETTAGALRSALRLCSAVTEKKNTVPILGAVHITGSRVRSTDLDMEIEVAVPGRSSGPAATILLMPLLHVLRFLDAHQAVTIEQKADAATLTFTGGSYDLPAFKSGEFPEFALGDRTARVKLDDSFMAALRFVLPCVSTEETRYYLNGVHVADEQMVATDGHRMAQHAITFDGKALEAAILPSKTARLLSTLPAPHEVRVHGRLKMEFVGDGYVFRSKTVDGTFPNWRRVIPDIDGATRIDLDARDTARALERLALGSINKYGNPAATIGWEGGKAAAVLQREGGFGGTSHELLASAKVDPAAKGHEGFNVGYLRTVLRAFKAGGTVQMLHVGAGSPAVFRVDQSGPFIVLMPMRREDGEHLAKAFAIAADTPSATTAEAA